MSLAELLPWALAAVLAALAYYLRPRPPAPPGAAPTPSTPDHAPHRFELPTRPLPAPDARVEPPPPLPATPAPGARVSGGLGRDHADEFVRSVGDL